MLWYSTSWQCHALFAAENIFTRGVRHCLNAVNNVPSVFSISQGTFFFSLTAIFLPLTPGYVISTSSFSVPRGLSGEIFCRVLGSRYALFTFARVSILEVTCLAIERWYCIFRPTRYKHHFTQSKLILYVIAIWSSTCLLQTSKFFEWKLSGDKCSSVKGPYGEHGTQALIVLNSLIGFYIPCFITWATFAHIALLFKTSPMVRCYSKRRRAQQKRLLRMCCLTSICLTFCWFPAQTIYILSPFGITKIGSSLHRAGGVLAMFNSCVNPVIYWVANREYRDGLLELVGFHNNRVKMEIVPLRDLRLVPGRDVCAVRNSRMTRWK